MENLEDQTCTVLADVCGMSGWVGGWWELGTSRCTVAPASWLLPCWTRPFLTPLPTHPNSLAAPIRSWCSTACRTATSLALPASSPLCSSRVGGLGWVGLACWASG